MPLSAYNRNERDKIATPDYDDDVIYYRMRSL